MVCIIDTNAARPEPVAPPARRARSGADRRPVHGPATTAHQPSDLPQRSRPSRHPQVVASLHSAQDDARHDVSVERRSDHNTSVRIGGQTDFLAGTTVADCQPASSTLGNRPSITLRHRAAAGTLQSIYKPVVRLRRLCGFSVKIRWLTFALPSRSFRLVSIAIEYRQRFDGAATLLLG